MNDDLGHDFWQFTALVLVISFLAVLLWMTS